MAWLVAHGIFYAKVLDGAQDEHPVWEKLFLIQADSEGEAWAKAEEVAKAYADLDDGMRYGDQPAKYIFKGIRKITGMIDSPLEIKLEHGEELTSSRYMVSNEQDADKLAQGEDVSLVYERYPDKE